MNSRVVALRISADNLYLCPSPVRSIGRPKHPGNVSSLLLPGRTRINSRRPFPTFEFTYLSNSAKDVLVRSCEGFIEGFCLHSPSYSHQTSTVIHTSITCMLRSSSPSLRDFVVNCPSLSLHRFRSWNFCNCHLLRRPFSNHP